MKGKSLLKRSRRVTKEMLMNYYGDETFEMCKNISREDAFRWLTQANEFLNKVIGIEKRLEYEKIMKKMGW